MEIICIILLILTVVFCWYKIEQNKKIQKEKYNLELEEIYSIEKQKIIERINKELEYLDKSIEEKQKFNDSILKLREDELQRIIEKEKEEKLLALENELAILKQIKMMNIERDASLYKIEMDSNINKMEQEVKTLQAAVDDYRMKRDSINEAILREKEIQEKEDFYKIDISQGAQEDITILEQIRPQLKNREALSKLIWDVFIQRPTTEMIKRVTAGRDVSGIYKITYIGTGEAYIGKTTNIKTRWQNHVRTVIGLEGAAHSTLHTHMEKHGLWNYTFEILEEVPKDKLTEREKFYINLYDTTKQLNMREG
jgi:hypothetical protein